MPLYKKQRPSIKNNDIPSPARLDGGGVRCSGRCAKVARLEQDDVVCDVPRVRVDGRRHKQRGERRGEPAFREGPPGFNWWEGAPRPLFHAQTRRSPRRRGASWGARPAPAAAVDHARCHRWRCRPAHGAPQGPRWWWQRQWQWLVQAGDGLDQAVAEDVDGRPDV